MSDLGTVDFAWDEAHPWRVHLRQYRALHRWAVALGGLLLIAAFGVSEPLAFLGVGGYALLVWGVYPWWQIRADRKHGHLDPDNGAYWVARAQWLKESAVA